MPASDKPLGLANDPTIGENLDEMVVSNRVQGFDYLESLRDSIARGSLFAALFAVAGPREGKARGYLTESVEIVGSGGGGTFSLASNDGARYDGEAYIGGLCPWRLASNTLLEQRASIFNIEHTDATLQNIPFSNTAAQTYQVGICCATYPTVAEQIPRIGTFQYTQEKTVVGYKVKPVTVTDLGSGQIKLDLGADAMIGAHSLAGRTAIVYLKSAPQTTTATAIATGTMTFSSPTNSVTVGYLGQVTPSTTAADYVVIVVGPVVTDDAAILNTNGYAHVGTIVGGTHVVDTDSQDVIPTMLGFMRDVITVARPSTNTARQNVMKLQVKAKAGESGVSQFEVLDSGASSVFSVNELGAIVGLSLALSGLLAVAAITCTTILATGLISANGGLAFTGAGAHITHATDNDIVVEFNRAADRTLSVSNVGAGQGRIDAGEFEAVTTDGGSGAMIAEDFVRASDFDREVRASVINKYYDWIPQAILVAGGTFDYNDGGGATVPYVYVGTNNNGTVHFFHVLDLNEGDEVVDIGVYGYRTAGGAVTVSLETWPMNAPAWTAVHHMHTFTGTPLTWVKQGSAPGSPVVFAGGTNDRFVLEAIMTNDAAAIDTARVGYLYATIRRPSGSTLTIELPLGG